MALSTIASWAGSSVSTIADWAGSSVVENLLSTAYSYLLDGMLPVDSETELKRLQIALPQITAVMGIAEALKMKHPDAGQWVEQFRQALEASEDVLDELEYKKLEDMVKNRDKADGSAFSSKKRKSCTINDDTLERLKEAVTMLDQAAAGVERLLQLATMLGIHDLSKSRQEAGKVLRRETTSFLAEKEVFGREVEKDKIISWLKQPSHAHLSSFSIIGVGGLGKTILAQFAYQEMRSSNHFDKTIWICVSTNFNVEDITRKMLGELGESSCCGKPLNAFQDMLKEKIYSKKILLVLDDVWDDEKRSDWEQLVAPLRFVEKGSKILFTTRMKSTANLLSSVISTEHESLALQGLREQELRLLFNSYVYHGVNLNNHRDLQAIGDQFVKMLQGSPLCAKVIGSLLNSHMECHYWRRILNHWSLFNLEQAKDVMEVLKLSYYHLPADLQVCFRFCSIFPQDHLFDKNDLIKMWIASGFIRQQLCQEERPEDIGEDYFNHLLRKSFFEYFKSREDEKYVMHDLMHELARNVSIGECCRVEPTNKLVTIPSTVRHVSVYESEMVKVFSIENLRSLVITSSKKSTGANSDPFVLPNNLIKKTLRVLKLYGHRSCELPQETSALVHLRYLFIETDVAQSFKYLLPTSIYKLYHLQVLEISNVGDYWGTETTEMTNLISLRYMRLPMEIMQTICGIHKLTSLQELTFFVGQEVGYHINEINSLNNLRHLSIKKIENIGDPDEAKNANLLGKQNLMSLFLTWTLESNPDNPEQIIDNLQPHQNLMELKIENYKGQGSPNWMRDLSSLNLSCLELSNCPMWKDLTFLQQMPYLKILSIIDCPNLDKLPDVPLSLIKFRVCNVGLTSLPDLYQNSDNTPTQLSQSSLKVLEVEKCTNLISFNGFLQQSNLDLQAIVKLTIKSCEKLVQLPTGEFEKLLSLEYLHIEDCPNLTRLPTLPLSLIEFNISGVPVNALPEYYQSPGSSGPARSSLKSSLKKVTITNCPNLTLLDGFMQQNNINIWAIEEISIENCKNLARVSIDVFGKFVSLKHISIRECPKLTRLPSLPLSVITFTVTQVGLSALPEYYQSSSSSGGPSTPPLESSLSRVWIVDCPNLTSSNGFLLQDNINFRTIERIYINDCKNLVGMGAFGNFEPLKNLSIGNCPNMTRLASLPLSLIEFRIYGLPINALPEYYQSNSSSSQARSSLKSSLKKVTIANCPNLTLLGGFIQQSNIFFWAIAKISISNCKNLVRVPTDAFGKFVLLKHLSIKNCPNLISLPSLPVSVITFAVDNVGLSSLPEYYRGSSSSGGPLTPSLESSLRKVKICISPNLTSLNGFLQQHYIDFHTIRSISIWHCENLVWLPMGVFGKFVSLISLTIYGCPKLVAIDNQSYNLLPTKLEKLSIANCGELDELLLESASGLTTLTNLRIRNCANINCIPSGGAFGSLCKLCIGGCDKLVELSLMKHTHDVRQGNKLASLKIDNLEIDHISLLLIEPLRSLRFVSYLFVYDCSGMEGLPEQWLLQNNSTLRSLTISDASSLQSLPSTMVRLTALERLQIRNAILLVELPELPASLTNKNIYGSDGQQL